MLKGKKGKEVDPAQLDFFTFEEANQEIQKVADELDVNTDTLLSGFVVDQSVTIKKRPKDPEKSRLRLEKNMIKNGVGNDWIGGHS